MKRYGITIIKKSGFIGKNCKHEKVYKTMFGAYYCPSCYRNVDPPKDVIIPDVQA